MDKFTTLRLAADGDGCLGRAADNEPVFVLRAKDRSAPVVVAFWASLQRVYQSVAEEKIDGAEEVAAEMVRWQQRYGSKIAD